MSKEDYREKIEEDRQEIELEGEQSRLSRSKLKTKKRKSKLIPTLLVTFIFIPLAVLLYLTVIYEPSSPVEVVEENNDVVQVQKNETPAVPEASEDKDKQEESEKEQGTTSSEELDKLSEAEQKELAAAQAAAAAEAAKAAEQKAKEEATKKAKEQEEKRKAEEEKRKAEEEAKKSQKTHTVQSNETLYRIAMKYYNDPNAVAKIKQANGLSSESIYVGQTLVLP